MPRPLAKPPSPTPAPPRSPAAGAATAAPAAARRGAQVQMFGRIGDDAHGRILRARLDADGIDHSGVRTDPNADTGMAASTVDAAAQNRIVVVPGANGRFMLDTDALRASLRQAHCLVMQFEIPLPQVLAAAGQAQAAGCPVLLNPSPMAPLPALQALPGAL